MVIIGEVVCRGELCDVLADVEKPREGPSLYDELRRLAGKKVMVSIRELVES